MSAVVPLLVLAVIYLGIGVAVIRHSPIGRDFAGESERELLAFLGFFVVMWPVFAALLFGRWIFSVLGELVVRR